MKITLGPNGRRLLATILAALTIAQGLVLVTASVANAAVFPPRYVRTIGGAGRPGVFAWGVQYNPVTHEILVSDYLNFKIRRYDQQGNHLGDFWRDNHVGQPYTIAVDPQDGVDLRRRAEGQPAHRRDRQVRQVGNFLSSMPVSFTAGPRGAPPTTPQSRFRAFYTVWMTVEEDTGDIFVLDRHYRHHRRLPALRAPARLDRPDDAWCTTRRRHGQELVGAQPPDAADPCTNPVAPASPASTASTSPTTTTI